jgi:hypothetical protein
MMTLLPRNALASHTKAKVGMLGGFFAITIFPRCEGQRENLPAQE